MSGRIGLRPGLLSMPEGLGEHRADAFEPMARLLRAMMMRWDDAGIEWAVLRNADALPDFTRYDVDILLRPDQRSHMLAIAEEEARGMGWRLAGRIRKRFYTCVMFQRGSVEEGMHFLPLDFFTALEFRGFRYLDADEALCARVRTERGVWTVPPAWEAAITLLKEWLPHGRLKTNSRDAVHRMAAECPEGVAKVLNRAVGSAAGTQLIQAALDANWERLPAIARPARSSITALIDWCRAALANIRHLFRPSLGMVVGLAGADGSGKSTLASELATRLYKRPFKGVRYIHGNMGILPRFRDIRAFVRRAILRRPPPPESKEPETLKGMMRPVPAWKSMALATYYAVDLSLARLLIRRWRGQWMLVIMDRSFYDYFYQLGHRRCPHGFLRIMTRLLPKPDFLFCLEGDPELIHDRKPELSVEEIRHEQEILAQLAESTPYARHIDGRPGVEAMVASAEREILRHLVEGRT